MDAKYITEAIADALNSDELANKILRDMPEDPEVSVETFAEEGIQETDHGLTMYVGDRGFRITVEEF